MANISKVTLPGGNDYYIKDSAITFCTCPTGASVAEKVVNPQNNPNFQLRQGAIIGVKFSNTNTASNVTLNVNNTGAKNIWYNASSYASTASGITGYKNRISYFMYDGTYWCLIHNGINNSNTTYAVVSTTDNGIAPKITNTSGYLKGDGTWAIPTNTTYANASTQEAGLLPQLEGGTAKYLRADGTWQTPPNNNTTYTISMSSNIITLTDSTGGTSTIALPIYNGGVT